MKNNRLRSFGKAILWAILITIMLAAQSYNSTRIKELQTQITQLKSVTVRVSDPPKAPTKRR